MARLGAFFCPFLVEGNISLVEIGIVMFFVHLFTVLCAAKLPETKGKDMGGGTHVILEDATDEETDSDGIVPVPTSSREG